MTEVWLSVSIGKGSGLLVQDYVQWNVSVVYPALDLMVGCTLRKSSRRMLGKLLSRTSVALEGADLSAGWDNKVVEALDRRAILLCFSQGFFVCKAAEFGVDYLRGVFEREMWSWAARRWS